LTPDWIQNQGILVDYYAPDTKGGALSDDAVRPYVRVYVCLMPNKTVGLRSVEHYSKPVMEVDPSGQRG